MPALHSTSTIYIENVLDNSLASITGVQQVLKEKNNLFLLPSAKFSRRTLERKAKGLNERRTSQNKGNKTQGERERERERARES